MHQIRPQNLLLIKGGHKPGFEVTLPYADDWQLSRKLPRTLLWADSKTADLIASVTVDSEKQPDEPEKYLQDLGKGLSANNKYQDSRLVRVEWCCPTGSPWISMAGPTQTNFGQSAGRPRARCIGCISPAPTKTLNFSKRWRTIPSLMDKGFKVTD